MATRRHRAHAGSNRHHGRLTIVRAAASGVAFAIVAVIALPPLTALGNTSSPTPNPSSSVAELTEASSDPTRTEDTASSEDARFPSPQPTGPEMNHLPAPIARAVAEEKSALLSAASAQRRFHAQQNLFLRSGPDLWDWGYEGSQTPDVVIRILRADKSGFCMSAIHAALYPRHVYYVSDETPAPTTEECR